MVASSLPEVKTRDQPPPGPSRVRLTASQGFAADTPTTLDRAGRPSGKSALSDLRERVYEILRDLRNKRGVTLLIVEESSERAVDAGDRIYVLRRGLIELEGTSEELADGERLHEAYFGFGAAGASPEAPQQ